MATNWNAILANVNNAADILSILKKVLGLLDGKVDLTKIDEIIENLDDLKLNVDVALSDVNSALGDFDVSSQEAIQQVIAAGLMEGFTNEAELLASRPNVLKKYAKAEDTDIIWFWNKPEGAPDGNYWTSTGESEFSRAKNFAINLNKSSLLKTSTSNLFNLAAAGGEDVFQIDEDATTNLVNLRIGGKYLSEIIQEAKDDVLKTDENTDLCVFPDKTKQKIVMALKANGRLIGAKPFDLGVDALFAKASSNKEMSQIGFYHDTIKSQSKEAYNFSKNIYLTGEDGFVEKIARMPSMIQISETRIFVSWCSYATSSDQEQGVMLGRFVDFNLQSKTATVDTNTVVMAGVRGTETSAFRHAAFGKVLNKQTGRFRYICLFNSGSFYNKNVKLLKIYSDDNCQTWSEPAEVMSETGGNPVALIPASIIRLDKGIYAGRLVVGGFFFSTTLVGQDRIGVLMSDDNGETWNVGGKIESGAFDTNEITFGFLNETSLCLDNSGNILLAIRNEGVSNINQRVVLFARSYDGGNSLVIEHDEPAIQTAVSEVSLLQTSQSLQDGIPKILLAFPSEPFADAGGYLRRSLRIGFSYNNGKTYPLMYTPRSSDGVSGYTHMIALSDQDFILVEEQNYYITTTFFNMSHVLKNGVFING
ncbi:exo-alpha-sialidase [Acinetobacter baumannii]|uniref:exo-alpha-sialidase n=1 Tax=Acinetobacter baumannii TaxID=470 RepID=UPI0037C0CF21